MKQIRLHAFDMNCVGHVQQGMWAHPRDRSADYLTTDYWMNLAQTLERGLFDGLFLADVLGAYDVYGGSPETALRHAVQIPVNDPMLVIPVMAHATTHLGFAVTANLSYERPYPFARRMSTLDHLTRGRVGWNIVTGYLDSAARAMGLERQVAHDSRYDVADEYMEVVYRLWEGSWADDAVHRDRDIGVYADPSRVQAVEHTGPRFAMRGVHLCEPSPQRTPVLYQAGSSARGLQFAARHAECVFVNGSSRANVARIVSELRMAVAASGRLPDSVLVFMGVTVVVGATEAEAALKLADYQRYASPDGALAQASGSMGIDLSAYGMDEPIHMTNTQAVVSNLEALTTRNALPVLTKRRLLGQIVLGGRQTPIVGTPNFVADEMMQWIAESGVDGFVLARTVTPECFEDVVSLLVPELQRRGMFKEAYAPGTLRQKLGGGALLAESHPALRYRQHAS